MVKDAEIVRQQIIATQEKAMVKKTAVKPAKKAEPTSDEEAKMIIVAMTRLREILANPDSASPAMIKELRKIEKEMQAKAAVFEDRAEKQRIISDCLYDLAGIFGTLAHEIEPEKPKKASSHRVQTRRRRGY